MRRHGRLWWAGWEIRVKKFEVLGEPVEILVDGEQSQGSMIILRQTCPPGGGPPPHRHTLEDESFTVADGEFEVFDGSAWHPLPRGEVYFSRRGSVHGFRNSGTTTGRILVSASPAGMENYLQ